MIFRLVVRHLRWLARVPGLPQVFDAALLAWTALAHRPRLAAMEAIETAALRRPGLGIKVHRLGGVEFLIEGREFGHLHGNGLLDVRVGREAARVFVRAGKAEPHHVFEESAWVSFWVCSLDDLPLAMSLLEAASEISEPALAK